MKPAGFENSQGIITAAYLKDPTDQQWDNDDEMKMWREWMTKYMPQANQADGNYIFAYAVGTMMHETLKKCGDDLTRENLMKQAANFQKLRDAAAAARHQRQHQPDRLLSDPGGPARRASRARPGSCSATSCRREQLRGQLDSSPVIRGRCRRRRGRAAVEASRYFRSVSA